MDSSLHCVEALQKLLRDNGDLNAISNCLHRLSSLPSGLYEAPVSRLLICDLILSVQWLRHSEECFQSYMKYMEHVPPSTMIQAFHMLLSKQNLERDVVSDAADLFIELFLQESRRFYKLFSESFDDKRRHSCCAFIVNTIAALPTLFANAAQGIVSPDLAPETFFSKFCTYAAFYLKEHHHANVFMMHAVAKLARSGMVEMIVAELLNLCLIPNDAWQLITVSDYCLIIEKGVTGLSSASEPVRALQNLLPQNIVDAHPSVIRTISRLFLDKTLCKRSSHALVQYLNLQADRSTFLNCLEEIASVWSATTALKNLSMIRQASLSQAVILFLEKTAQIELNASSSLVSHILNGVQDRLRSPTADTRIMGMRVGEALSLKLTPDQPLVFANEDEEEDAALRSDIEFGLGIDLHYFEGLSSSNSQGCEATVPVDADARNVTWLHGERLPDDEEFRTVNDKLDLAVKHGLHDEFLPPKQVHAPRFLRECLEFLREKKPYDSREYFECALESVPKLIHAEPNDLRSCSISLALHILSLNNKYATSQFNVLRKKALVAILSSYPDVVGPGLIRAFYLPNYTISNRLLVLDVLCETAQSLSTIQPPALPTESKNDIKLIPLREVQPISLEISERIKSKTRRWGRQRSKLVSGINKFAIVADSLLFFLLSQDMSELPFRLYTDDVVILVRLLQVSGIIVECGGASANFKASLECLFKLLWSVKGHESVSVRLASLFALCRILLVQGTFFCCKEDATRFGDVLTWLHETYNHDPDSDVRDLALYSISLLSDRWFIT